MFLAHSWAFEKGAGSVAMLPHLFLTLFCRRNNGNTQFTIQGVLISDQRHSWDSKADFYCFKKKKGFKTRRPNSALRCELILWIKFLEFASETSATSEKTFAKAGFSPY